MGKLTVLRTSQQMQKSVMKYKSKGKRIGFVPTMGALHEGHASLIQKSVHDNDVTVVSIFVNPLQFGPQEDFSKYPRTFKNDKEICEKMGADIIFLPDSGSFYGKNFHTYVDVEEITEPLCGHSRPGHFRGVTTVVAKLFNTVLPDHAYFGQKDYQQLTVIKKMVKDLDFPIKIIACPIVRDKDGLALSSRNRYLTPDERGRALCLSSSLQTAKRMVKTGERNALKIIKIVRKSIKESIIKTDRIDYISLVDAETLEEVPDIKKQSLLAVAVHIGKTRLIDNILLR